jgi:hypothetical protein
MRRIFTGRLDSTWNFILGMTAYKVPIIILLFLLYKYYKPGDINTQIDILEFFIGLSVGALAWNKSVQNIFIPLSNSFDRMISKSTE